jgi:hypothetical protein
MYLTTQSSAIHPVYHGNALEIHQIAYSVLLSSREIQEDFSNIKRYSSELSRQSIWSFQKSFCPSFCWVWENSYFSWFLAWGPSHLLTSGSCLYHVFTPEYLLGNKSESSLDTTKYGVVSILNSQLPYSDADLGLSTAACPDFYQSGCSGLLFQWSNSFASIDSGLSRPESTNHLKDSEWRMCYWYTATDQSECWYVHDMQCVLGWVAGSWREIQGNMTEVRKGDNFV